MGLRRSGRELALKVLYQMDIVGDHSLHHVPALLAFTPSDPRARQFAQELIKGVAAEMVDLDRLLSEVITNWSINRLSRIDHNILRIGAYELLRMEDIPTRATLDEAIELAKRYGDQGSSQFVNGVLDMVAQRLGLKHKGEHDLGAAKP